MTRRLRALALAAALLAVPAPALAVPAAGTLADQDLPLGGGSFSLGIQNQSTYGPTASFRTALQQGGFEMGASLMAPPSKLLSFFTADAYIAFQGQTGSFLPINLLPVMGCGFGTSFLDVPDGRGDTKTDLNLWMYMPVGLRYAMKLGTLSIGAEALYHLPALWLIKGPQDPSRWHFGVQARRGNLFGELFQETGAVYNGPGARAGLIF
jgi:hypothetical protein